MKKYVSMLLCLVLVLSLFAGCTKKEETAAPEASAAPEATPAETATDSNQTVEVGAAADAVTEDTGRTDLVFGITSEPAYLTPYRTDEYTSYTLSYQLFDRLLDIDAHGVLGPSIAESWEYSDDGLEITFHLKKGVKFHDGSELTAEDVAWTYNQAIATPATGGVTGAMDRMEVVDPYTCKLFMKETFGAVEGCCAFAQLGIVQKAGDEADPDGYARNPIGTGSYKFVRWDMGDKIVMEANDEYWGGAPAIKDLTFKICLDTNAALVALENGEIDLCDTIPVAQRATVEGNDKIAYVAVGNNATYFLQLENNKAPFDDVRVRQAFQKAIDKEAVVIGALDGNGQTIEAMMLADVEGYPKDFVSVHQYDPEAAKALLKEAGYDESNPLVVEFTCMDDSRMLPIAEVVQECLRQVGVDAQIQKYERAAWLQKVRTEHDYLMALMNTSALYPDADYLYTLYHSDYVGGRNWGDVSIPELDALLEAGRASTDKEERAEIYRQVVTLMDEQAVCPVITRMDQPYFMNANLKGFVANSMRRCFVKDYSW